MFEADQLVPCLYGAVRTVIEEWDSAQMRQLGAVILREVGLHALSSRRRDLLRVDGQARFCPGAARSTLSQSVATRLVAVPLASPPQGKGSTVNWSRFFLRPTRRSRANPQE